MPTASPPIDAHALRKLRWRCRRGLLENDLFIEHFFAQHAASLTVAQGRALESLMALCDNDLLDLLLARTEPKGELASSEVDTVLALMRKPPVRRTEPIATVSNCSTKEFR